MSRRASVAHRPQSLPASRPLSAPSQQPSSALARASAPGALASASGGASARYSDRYIPSRAASGDFRAGFQLLGNNARGENARGAGNGVAEGGGKGCYEMLLKSELLDGGQGRGEGKGERKAGKGKGGGVSGGRVVSGGGRARVVSGGNLFRFGGGEGGVLGEGKKGLRVGKDCDAVAALAAMRSDARRGVRKISRLPFKVLDAPNLMDDFYLNLVDWSADNVLAVGLGTCVYLWSACTSLVTKLCDLNGTHGSICSVSWSLTGKELAVGTSRGIVQVWDTVECVLMRTMGGHDMRVGCLAWSSTLLSSGSKDCSIYNRDLRSPESYIDKLGGRGGHTQEVCGLKWSFDDTQLASGGNDNHLLVWSAAKTGGSSAAGGRMSGTGFGSGAVSSGGLGSSNRSTPLLRFTLHNAAVKAIAWSPHARGLLASGGGTADKTIRFWNTVNDSALACVDTGSQVCNLSWSKNVNELVSTHGYSQNQIIVWRYPSLSKVVTLTGHGMRVLYLAVSPNGETIVTGCGDETLRFWNLFPSASSSHKSARTSLLSPERMHIR